MADRTHEEVLFNAARALTDPRQLAAFLDQACAGDDALRHRLEALLGVQAEAEAFFDSKAVELDKGSPPLERTALTPCLEKPGDQIGRYKLLQQMGEGGCGVVYVAEQEEPVHRRVALKVIKLGMAWIPGPTFTASGFCSTNC